MKKTNFYNLFYIFIITSIFGWLIEVLWTLIKKGVVINHSAVVIGPFNMVYGVCAVMLSLFLMKYKDKSNIKLFIYGFIGGTILEYILSIIIELVNGFPAWNYTGKLLNINGRVCLETMIPFGILGTVVVYLINPFFLNIVLKIPTLIRNILAIIIFLMYITDNIISYMVMNKIKGEIKKHKGDNTELIRKNVTEWLEKNTILYRHIKNAYPKFKITNYWHNKNNKE